MADSHGEFIQKLEKEGLEVTRQKLMAGKYSRYRKEWAEEWVAEQDRRQAAAHKEETLDLARKADKRDRPPKTIKFWASVAAIVAAIFTIATFFLTC